MSPNERGPRKPKTPQEGEIDPKKESNIYVAGGRRMMGQGMSRKEAIKRGRDEIEKARSSKHDPLPNSAYADQLELLEEADKYLEYLEKNKML